MTSIQGIFRNIGMVARITCAPSLTVQIFLSASLTCSFLVVSLMNGWNELLFGATYPIHPPLLLRKFSRCLNLGSVRIAVTTNPLFAYILQTILIGLVYPLYFFLGTYWALTKLIFRDTIRRNVMSLINITSIQSVIFLYSFRICFGILVMGAITRSTFLLVIFPFNAYIFGP